MTNRTVCFTQANRDKNNRIPSELPNYTDIQDRIRPWRERVEHIKSQIELWKGKARTATTVERKNECIRQKHLWELESDYWQAKVRTFTLQKDDIDQGFRNSQLVDTRIITKYAFHYLKSVFSRVDVEKGSVTADFRKILGIQSADDKKDRSKHSHHAIDAAVLTMIPVAAQRDRMIELFYQCEEATGWEKDLLRDKLNKEIESCNIGSINGMVETIENNILVNHISKDQTLSPARKPRYVNNKKMVGQWCQGDSIRGSLHKDTFYGAIQSEEGLMIAVRKTLKQGAINSIKESEIELIIDPIIRKTIQEHWQHWKGEGYSFVKAMEEPTYMLNREGEPVTHDRNGRPIAPIRHVRCKQSLKYDTALKIKQQTYSSKHEYKNDYLAKNDDIYLCLLYEGMQKGKQRRKCRMIGTYEIAQLHLHDASQLKNEPEFMYYEGNILLPLKAIMKRDTRVLFYKNYREELFDLDKNLLSERLYILYKFNDSDGLSFRHHLEARTEEKCNPDEKGVKFDPTKVLSYISKLKAVNFTALIEHYDFEIDPLGNIRFK